MAYVAQVRADALAANRAGPPALGHLLMLSHLLILTAACSRTLPTPPNCTHHTTPQHAFHHLEEHLDTTPLKYMFKRFGLGTDQVGCCAL
jgi:hypothetical protein